MSSVSAFYHLLSFNMSEPKKSTSRVGAELMGLLLAGKLARRHALASMVFLILQKTGCRGGLEG